MQEERRNEHSRDGLAVRRSLSLSTSTASSEINPLEIQVNYAILSLFADLIQFLQACAMTETCRLTLCHD